MPGKVVPLEMAIAGHVKPGCTVFVGGFGQAVPFAAGREIVRQRIDGLTLCRTGADILFDLLVGAGCVRKLIVGWYGNPGIGISHVWRRLAVEGRLEVEESSNFGLLLRLKAAALGVPFLPTHTLRAGDLPAASGVVAEIACPFTGTSLAAVPALTPDVAVIHAEAADEDGNVRMGGIVGDTLVGAKASRRVVCTVERIVPRDEIRAAPERTALPAHRVDAVALAPRGAEPSYVAGHYGRDDDSYRAFDGLSRDPAALARHIAAWTWPDA